MTVFPPKGCTSLSLLLNMGGVFFPDCPAFHNYQLVITGAGHEGKSKISRHNLIKLTM